MIAIFARAFILALMIWALALISAAINVPASPISAMIVPLLILTARRFRPATETLIDVGKAFFDVRVTQFERS